MNNVKLLHIKCCFYQIFNSPVALKNKKMSPPWSLLHVLKLLVTIVTGERFFTSFNSTMHSIYNSRTRNKINNLFIVDNNGDDVDDGVLIEVRWGCWIKDDIY